MDTGPSGIQDPWIGSSILVIQQRSCKPRSAQVAGVSVGYKVLFYKFERNLIVTVRVWFSSRHEENLKKDFYHWCCSWVLYFTDEFFPYRQWPSSRCFFFPRLPQLHENEQTVPSHSRLQNNWERTVVVLFAVAAHFPRKAGDRWSSDPLVTARHSYHAELASRPLFNWKPRLSRRNNS